MSIDRLIHWRVAEKRLFPLLPRAAGGTVRRAMFLSEELWELLATSHEDLEMEERIGGLQADLETFVESPTIDSKYLFLLYPARDAVWEVRSVRPDPSIRVLGLFAADDVFVATNYALRESLGSWQSREWKEVKRVAHRRWTQLFHPYQPRMETSARRLVSGAIDGRYFKERA
jgi:hypothetical protein